MTWRYATMKGDGPLPTERLDEMGERGWELVSVVGPGSERSGTHVAYFKRPIAPEV